ncbi:hypothetical protein [Alkalispirochaeta sphaeroplastigenens]|uniref:hypothetical protein n=1 Tax=Alkalispirochaeta sphaeroplastigenens TaxID=1187066 RepID=UPI0011AF83C7|nr:hypothetical protein [Alkalispirochaeta sphaeroplastigenens]
MFILEDISIFFTIFFVFVLRRSPEGPLCQEPGVTGKQGDYQKTGWGQKEIPVTGRITGVWPDL